MDREIVRMGKKEIKAFIEKVAPKNWVVSLDGKIIMALARGGFKKKPSESNCQLYIDLYLEEEGWNNSEFGHTQNHIKDCDGYSYCDLHLNLKNIASFGEYEEVSLEGTIIHELAHIAVNRLKNFRMAHGKRMPVENMHGPTFQKALITLRGRAVRVYGNELEDVFHELEQDLDMYQNFSDQ